MFIFGFFDRLVEKLACQGVCERSVQVELSQMSSLAFEGWWNEGNSNILVSVALGLCLFHRHWLFLSRVYNRVEVALLI